jgi:O-acetyl-ADP-ribose deacetylase (regulator of RNase III)
MSVHSAAERCQHVVSAVARYRRIVNVQSAATPHISVVLGDITRERVDAIVNAANEYLMAGGGVDHAIHVAAGEKELSAACAKLGGCKVGDAKVTPGFALPARYIFHAVGPRWSGGDRGEPDLLASCYRRCLALGDELEARSLAFPAISTGAFGFPPDHAAAIAVRTLRNTPTSVSSVRLVAFDQETQALYAQLLDGS